MSDTDEQLIRLAKAVTITPHTDIEVVRLVEAIKADTPQIIRTREELEALDPETLVIDSDGKRWLVSDAIFHNYLINALDWHHVFIKSLPAVVIATGEQVRATRKALEEQA